MPGVSAGPARAPTAAGGLGRLDEFKLNLLQLKNSDIEDGAALARADLGPFRQRNAFGSRNRSISATFLALTGIARAGFRNHHRLLA